MSGGNVEGFCAAGFEAAVGRLAENIASEAEIGASFAVSRNGRPVGRQMVDAMTALRVANADEVLGLPVRHGAAFPSNGMVAT